MRQTANGIAMNYEISGPAGAPLVVLSHSLAASLDMWAGQVPALEAKYRVLRYDLRGHGTSEVTPPPYTLDLLADDAIALIDSLGGGAAHFVGMSIGGMIGQVLGLRYPERVGSLVLSNTSSRMPPETWPVWDERIAVVRDRGLAGIADGTIERWFTEDFRNGHGELVAPIRDDVLATPANGYIGCAEAIKALDLADKLGAIKTPTLVIAGQHDMATPPAAGQAIADAIAGAGIVVLDAAHISSVEQSALFNAAVLAFLEANASA